MEMWTGETRFEVEQDLLETLHGGRNLHLQPDFAAAAYAFACVHACSIRSMKACVPPVQNRQTSSPKPLPVSFLGTKMPTMLLVSYVGPLSDSSFGFFWAMEWNDVLVRVTEGTLKEAEKLQ